MAKDYKIVHDSTRLGKFPGAMTRLGSASASQIVAAFRHDSAVLRICKRDKCTWPKSHSNPFPDREVPSRRLDLISKSRGSWALYCILECNWSAYDCSSDALAEMRAYNRGEKGLLTVGAAYKSYTRVPEILFSDASIERILKLRLNIRSDDFDEGVFLAITADAGRLLYPAAPLGSLCLLDGHHRFIALMEEARMPETVKLFLGTVPDVRAGLAVINGGAGK